MLLVYFLISQRPLTQWIMVFYCKSYLVMVFVAMHCLGFKVTLITGINQFVTYNRVSSDKKEVKCGVSQGSILGPLLFLIYIHDLSDVCKCSLPILFADDTNLFHHGSDLSVIENAFNKELADISKWLKVNKLSLNIKKTHHMIFSRKKSNYQLDLRIDNQKIDETSTTKFLGVYIDNKLNWKTHISYVGGKIGGELEF